MEEIKRGKETTAPIQLPKRLWEGKASLVDSFTNVLADASNFIYTVNFNTSGAVSAFGKKLSS